MLQDADAVGVEVAEVDHRDAPQTVEKVGDGRRVPGGEEAMSSREAHGLSRRRGRVVLPRQGGCVGLAAMSDLTSKDVSDATLAAYAKLDAKIESVRADMRAELEGVRTEVVVKIAAARAELRDEIQDVRRDVIAVRTALRALEVKGEGIDAKVSAPRPEPPKGTASRAALEHDRTP